MRRKSQITLVNLREELERLQNSEEFFLNNDEFAELIGMSPAWYYMVLKNPTTSTYRKTIKNIADRLNKDFKIEGDRITFLNRDEKPQDSDIPEDRKELYYQLRDRIEAIENEEKRKMVLEALDLIVHYSEEQIEALKILLGAKDRK